MFYSHRSKQIESNLHWSHNCHSCLGVYHHSHSDHSCYHLLFQEDSETNTGAKFNIMLQNYIASRCCVKEEPLYDVPDYYEVPPLPPRNEIPIVECDAKLHEISGHGGNQDESSQQRCDPINGEAFPSTIPDDIEANVVTSSVCPDSEAAVDEAKIQMQDNHSYQPSTTFSDFAANPAYGINIAIAPEIFTEQNEAYSAST